MRRCLCGPLNVLKQSVCLGHAQNLLPTNVHLHTQLNGVPISDVYHNRTMYKI